MLKVDSVVKVYNKGKKNEFHALDGVSIEFPERGFVFIVGKSGCGKTTLLNVLAKLDEPDAGTVTVDGKSEFSRDEADDYRNKHIGVIFQEFNLLQDFTVAENISLAREINREKISAAEIDALLADVELTGLAKRKIGQLSGGQRQRVAIARTLAKTPKVILADEPTGNLDKNNGLAVMEILKKLSSDRLVVVITHDREAAEKYGDRIIGMQDGRISFDTVRNEGFKGDIYEEDGAVYVSEGLRVTEELAGALNTATTVLSAKEKRFSPTVFVADGKGDEYVAHQPTRLPLKTVARLSFLKIKKHKIRFIISLLLIVVSLTVFGISGIIAGYDVGAVSAENFERFSEHGILIQKAEDVPPFGYVDRFYGRLMFDEDREKLSSNAHISNLNDFYHFDGQNFVFNDVMSGNEWLYNGMGGMFETSKVNLAGYGYEMLCGDFPASSERDADGLLHLAITDYTAYVMADRGVQLRTSNNATDYESIFDFAPEALVGRAVKFKSQDIVIDGVLKTDFAVYRDDGRIKLRAYELDDETLQTFYNRINFFWSAFYAADGTSSKLFVDNVLDDDAWRRTMNLSYYMQATGQDVSLADGEVLMSDKTFKTYFSGESAFDAGKEYKYKFYIEYENEYVELGEYKVAGVFRDTAFAEPALVVMSDKEFEKVANGGVLLTGFYTALPEGSTARTELINFLDDNLYFHKTVMSYIIYDIYNDFSVYRMVFLYLAIILAVAGALFVIEFMMGNIKDRQNEIGILRAMGVRGRDISKMFVMQAILIFALGAALITALVIGLTELLNVMLYDGFLAKLSTYLIDYVPLLTPTLMPFVLTVSILAGVLVLAALLPTLKLIRMKPIDCIKER